MRGRSLSSFKLMIVLKDISKRYKNVLKNIVENFFFRFSYSIVKNKAIASGIFEKLQKLVKLWLFRWMIAIIIHHHHLRWWW